MRAWGLLPIAVVAEIERREWQHGPNLRARLCGDRPFPLRMLLKAPSGAQALADLEHFRQFIASWKAWPQPGQLEWQRRKYQHIGEHNVPVALRIDSMPDLIALLGSAAEARSRRWEQLMRPLLAIDSGLSAALLKHLDAIESMTDDNAALLAAVVPQLRPGLGQDAFLRALPLKDVDTKFVEEHAAPLIDLLDSLHASAVTNAGGLVAWLGCRANPGGWLQVRPLCRQSRERLAGLPLLQLDTQTLQEYPLPATRILIVENKQSGYALPALEDTIVVFGGGRNISWMDADWLAAKQIAYWGDIDSWGLAILSDARRRQPRLQALMMNEAVILQHQTRMVDERESYKQLPEYLTEAERQLFERLQNRYYGKTRLEQERLAPDYVLRHLNAWLQVTK
jgi:hypothetical protein